MTDEHKSKERLIDTMAIDLFNRLNEMTSNPALAFGAAFTLLLQCSRNVEPVSRQRVLTQITDTLRMFWAAWDEWEKDDDTKPVM